MMSRIAKIVVLIFLFVFIIQPFEMVLAEDKANKVLIIFDSYKEYAKDKNILDELVKITLPSKSKIEIRKINNYTEDEIKSSDEIIVLSTEEGSLSDNEVKKLYELNNNIIWMGDNTIKKDSKEEKKLYLLLSELYPYDDLNILVKKADYLYERGIPFLVEAMPVFDNLEFNAMKNYVEALRYCTSKGGAIILGAPYIYASNTTEDELIERMKIAQKAFLDYWVYPIGISTPNSWLYRNDRKKYLDISSTIVIKNDELGVLNFDQYTINSFENVLIEEDLNDTKIKNELIKNKVIPLIEKMEMDEFKKYIDDFKGNGVKFSNLYNLNSKMIFGDNTIINNRMNLYFNGVQVRSNNFISREDFEGIFSKEITKEDTGAFDLTNINKIIFGITIVGLIIFLIFLLGSIRRDRRKYFK